MTSTHREKERLDEVIARYTKAEQQQVSRCRDQFLQDHPELADQLTAHFRHQDELRSPAGEKPQHTVRSGHAPQNETAGEDLTLLPQTVALPSRRGSTPNQSAEAISHSDNPAAVTPPSVEDRFGDYQLLEKVAQGGMGVVYKARQISLNRIVAIKMIRSGHLASPADVQRFYTEAEAAANLGHPGIVPIYEVNQYRGQHYFSMGFVDGQDLAHRISEGLPSPQESAQIVQQMAAAMAYAHDHGVIHRDLKPANVLISEDGQPQITDFGLAKRVEGNTDLTSTGQILGTPGYMPPEQAAGQQQRIGPLSDVYSLGAVLYELLTGRPPFQADSPLDTVLQVLEDEPPAPKLLNRNVPLDLQTICLKCLQKDPAARYQSAGELNADLRRYLAGDTIIATNVNLLGRVSRALGQSRHEEQVRQWGKGLILIGLTVLTAHVAIFVLQSAGAGPLFAYWIPRGVMFGVILGLLCSWRPQTLLPTNAAERLIWAVGIGYILATGVMNLLLSLGGVDRDFRYGFCAVLSGTAFFTLGGHVWGGCYVVGLAFLLASPVLIAISDFGALGFGLLWGAALITIGLYYRRLERRTTQSPMSMSSNGVQLD